MVSSGAMEEIEVTWILYLGFSIHRRKASVSFGTLYLLKCSSALLPSFSSATPEQAKNNPSHLNHSLKNKKPTKTQKYKTDIPKKYILLSFSLYSTWKLYWLNQTFSWFKFT